MWFRLKFWYWVWLKPRLQPFQKKYPYQVLFWISPWSVQRGHWYEQARCPNVDHARDIARAMQKGTPHVYKVTEMKGKNIRDVAYYPDEDAAKKAMAENDLPLHTLPY